MANQPTKYRKFVVGAASAALVASAVAPVAGAATKDFSDIKGNTHEAAINALVEAGVINGYEDGTFKPNKTLTRSDVVKMMGKWLVSLGYEVPSDYKTNPRFTDQTSSTNEELLQYSALVKDHGVFNGYENGSLGAAGDITRENMAIVLVRAFDAINETDLVAFVAEQDFDKDVTDRATAKAEARPYIDVLDYFDITNPIAPQFNPKATTTRGQFATFLHKTSTVEVEEPVEEVVTATKVESVSATNLKEVVVNFDGTVDRETAEDASNYSLKSGKVIKSAELSEDEKTVTLTLEGTLTNNKVEAVSVSNVKAGDKVISASNVEFNVFDNQIPAVVEVKSLGTKAVKVVFSEPVKDPKQSNFTLDGKAFYGKVTVVGNEVILTPYTALTTGDHTIQVSKVEDYAGFTSLTSTNTFTVVEDKEAPTITSAEATLETLTLTFSEDVDVDTVSASKVYWKSGNDKKAAYDFDQVAGNKFKFYFKDDKTLPTGSVAVFVEGVKDYSGNQIAADTKVLVTPEIDQTRPSVKDVDVVDAKTLEITFTKNLEPTSAQLKSNYTVLDKDGKVIAVESATLNKNVVTLKLYSNLSTGNNTLTVKNVKDNTKLQNTMLDFSETIVKADTAQPTIDSVTANERAKEVVVAFDEKMDVATLTNYSNYLVNIDNQLRALTPDIADLNVLHDGRVVVITFAEKLGSKNVSFVTTGDSTTTQVKELHVLGVKDVAGNVLSNFTSSSNRYNLADATNKALELEEATLVDLNTVELKFNVGITDSSLNAISAIGGPAGQTVESIEVDGTSTIRVNFSKNFNYDKSNVNFTVNPASLQTLAGPASGAAFAVTPGDVEDAVKPKLVDGGITATGDTITLTFSENIKDAGIELVASDLEVRVNGTLLSSSKGEFTVATGTTGDAKFNITVHKAGVTADDVTVTLTNGRYIQDLSGNVSETFSATRATGTITTPAN